ncbi:MAG: MarR family transcriptional regulator [Candidatus Hodarchaeota archaeon]
MQHLSSSEIGNLPPSSKYVYFVLLELGPLTRKQLRDITNLKERTLSNALNKLIQNNLVNKQQGASDLREKIYYVF